MGQTVVLSWTESFWRMSCFFRQGQSSGIATLSMSRNTPHTLTLQPNLPPSSPGFQYILQLKSWEEPGMRLYCACTEAASLSCMHDGVLARHSHVHCYENCLWAWPVAGLRVPKVPRSSQAHTPINKLTLFVQDGHCTSSGPHQVGKL